MAQPTLSVLDSTGATVTIKTINANGAAADADSQPVTISSDQIGTTLSPTLKLLSMQAPDHRPAGGNITVVDSGSTTTTAQANGSTLVTGTPTASSFLTFALNGRNGAAVSLSGTWTGTVQFEVSYDGGTTYGSGGMHTVGSVYRTGTATLNGLFTGPTSGATHFRVRAIAAMTGTCVVAVSFSSYVNSVRVAGPISISDNSSGQSATIKPASTAPLATDPALVVAISPNGQRALGVAPSASSPSVVTASDDVNIGPIILVNGATVSGVNQDIIASMSVLPYRGGYFHLVNAGTTCTITVQGSNDNTNWFSVCAQDISVPSASPPVATITSAKIVAIPLGFAFLRIRCTTYGSGSPTGVLTLSPTALTPFPMFATSITPNPVITSGPTTFAHGANAVTAVINTNVKNSGTILCGGTFTNQNASAFIYFKLFNKASAATLGTDTPVWVIPIPPKTTIVIDAAPFGNRFTAGITVVATNLLADSDATTIALAGDAVYNIICV